MKPIIVRVTGLILLGRLRLLGNRSCLLGSALLLNGLLWRIKLSTQFGWSRMQSSRLNCRTPGLVFVEPGNLPPAKVFENLFKNPLIA
jgi:hypothetical protein